MHKRRRLRSISNEILPRTDPNSEVLAQASQVNARDPQYARDLWLFGNDHLQVHHRLDSGGVSEMREPQSSIPQTSPKYPHVANIQQPYWHQPNSSSAYKSSWPLTYQDGSGQSPNMNDRTSTSCSPPKLHSSTSPHPREHTSSLDGRSQTSYGEDSDFRGIRLAPINVPSEASMDLDEGHRLEDVSVQLKIQSLPVLENLAIQIIQTFSKVSYHCIQYMIQRADTEEIRAYLTLKGLFDQTRKVYERDTQFIDAIATQMIQPQQQETIRRANIATFVSSVLSSHDVSFFQLNEFFMETFVPLGSRLLKWQGEIFLELKTQAYISALMNSDGDREAILEELFPNDLDAQILSRHPDAASLSPSEQDFVDRTKARKNYLFAEPFTSESIRDLPKKYQWSDFVREFLSCITKNVDSILNLQNCPQMGTSGNISNLSRYASMTGTSLASITDGSLPNPSALLDNPSTSELGSLLTNVSGIAAPNLDSKRPISTSTTVRQPWTKAEEDALLVGLEKVGGPHWSQILTLYGRGGATSEVLKDRNQVQLKDKARNLKLWYLKMGKEVPAALRGVTGELRKRGGARARAALSGKDDVDSKPSIGDE